MDFKEQLRVLHAADGDPAKLALATVDLKYPTFSESSRLRLKSALEAAAIPHWCDGDILASLLEITPTKGACLLSKLRGLRVVESFTARGDAAVNIHEASRLALRKSLAKLQPDRFLALSARAEMHLAEDFSAAGRIERMFHRLIIDPERAGREISQLELELRHNVEDGLALAASLREYISDVDVPPLVRCWACWIRATIEQPYLKIGKQLELASRALEWANAAGSDYAAAAALGLIGNILVERGQDGDAHKALDYYTRCLEIHERLVKANPESEQAARDFSVSLKRLGLFLETRGQDGDAHKALNYFMRCLEIHERLLKTNPESAQAARDLSVTLGQLGQFLETRGQVGDAHKAQDYYTRCLEIHERLLKANPESAQAARDLSVTLGRLGLFLETRGQDGDAQKALNCYTRCLEIREELLNANPESAEAACDFSVSLGKLGYFLETRGQDGDAQKALYYYTRSVEIQERLLKANPESAEAARDLSVSLGLLGDFLATKSLDGDGKKALDLYTRCLEVDERLLKANPESALAARDLSVSLGRLANFLTRRGQDGDAQKASYYYLRCLEIDERLLKANPESAQAARDLSLSLGRLGEFFAKLGHDGDSQKALECYTQCVSLHEQLHKANPESAQAARDLSLSLVRLGDLVAERGQDGDAQKALNYFMRCLEIHERLLQANPESAQAASDLSLSLGRLGEFLAKRGHDGDAQKALDYYTRSLEIDERLLKANPESAQAASNLSLSLRRLGEFLAKRGHDGDAQKVLDYLIRFLQIRKRLLKANPKSAHGTPEL